MKKLASLSISNVDHFIEVGEVILPDGHDVLWFRVVQTGGPSPWNFSYGLLSWITDEGRELGTVNVYPHSEGEVFRLFNGRKPSFNTGLVSFEPRNYNLAWLKTSGLTLDLDIFWDSGTSSGGIGEGAGAVASGFDNEGEPWKIRKRENFAVLT